MKKVIIFDGSTAWTVDHNGFTRELSGPEKAQAAVSSAIALFRYVEQLPDPYSLKLVEEQDDQYVLSLTYGGEGEHLLYLDNQEFLVRKVVVQHFGLPTEAILDEYRPEGGISIPHRTVQSMGGTGLEITVTVDEVRINPELPDSLFREPAAQVADSRLASGTQQSEVPLARVGPYLLAQATLNDSAEAWFLIDSGSGATCLDSSLVRGLGLTSAGEIETRGVAGAATASFVELASLALPGARLEGQSVASVNLAPVAEFVRGDMAGILGWDFLSRFVVKLDYRRGMMTLHSPETFAYEGPGHSLTARVQLNVPQIEVAVEGHHGWFVLDTGNGGSLMLHSPFVQATGLMRNRGGLVGSTIRGIGGEQDVRFGRIDSLAIGPYTMRDVACAFSTAEEGFLASREVAGNIGNQILERFTVYLDLPHERVVLEPNELYEEPLDENMTGLVLTSRLGRVMVEKVLPGSPAETAGIVPGEFVLEVGDLVTDGQSPVEVADLLKRPVGSTLRLRLERHGVAHEAILEIRPFF
jgi:outer membrane lipoprotein-sorting protein